MSTQSVRVWFAVLTIGRRKPTSKGFSFKCASVMCAGGFRTLVNNIPKSAIKDACDAYKRFFKGYSKFPKFKKSANIPSHESIGIDLGIKDLAICSDGNKYQNINKSQVVKKLEKKKRRLQRSISSRYEKNKEGGANNA